MGRFMTWIDLSKLEAQEPAPGYRVRFVHTPNVTLGYWDVDEGSSLPEHVHPHEQTVNILEGTFELTVDGEARIIGPGHVVVIPPNVPHGGRAITRCYRLDVFHPVREDYKKG